MVLGALSAYLVYYDANRTRETKGRQVVALDSAAVSSFEPRVYICYSAMQSIDCANGLISTHYSHSC